ncbi:MAG: glycosyltransferase family 2 protein [Deltaproteobacteria bacterium]|nr:glycosyltransferase family 2 protein [Nannocystaceae bacterium]
MKLLVVIVNYKTAELTLRAVASALPDVTKLGGRITVVDNASGDGSLERLGAGIAALGEVPVELVAAERNGGFGYGNNLAIRRALASDDPPELVYLLNPDAVAAPGAIARMVEFMAAQPDVGIAGSHITNPDGTTHVSAFRFPSPLGEVEGALKLGIATKLLHRWSVWSLPCDRTCRVDWVSGASTLIRREVLEGVGLFDENFFLYFEETDLCRRATLAGWQIWFVREASVEHLVAAATGIGDVKKRVPAYWFQSRRYYFLKQGGARELWLANVGWLAAQSLWRVRRRIQRKPDVDPPHLLLDFVRHNVAAARSRPKR